jgi:hypothetical protein
MIIMRGEIIKNKMRYDLFIVKQIKGSRIVMLEDKKGDACIWL